jgi:hypothetical protein
VEKGIFELLRVMQEPMLVKGLRRKELLYLCSDGNFYRQQQLSKKINLCPEAFRARAARMHWSHPDFLAPSKTNRKKHRRTMPVNPLPAPAGSLAKLSESPRRKNLAKLDSPGSFEQSLNI